MRHIHFEKIDSTQTYIRNVLEKEKIDTFVPFIVSCESQTSGYGRSGNSWEEYEKGIATSFLLIPNEVLTLTSLEMGILVSQFVLKKMNQKLLIKWPNDLYNENLEKVGGILIQNKNNFLIIGLGLNFGHKISKNVYEYQSNAISNSAIEKSKFCQELYQFILENRLSPQMIKHLFIKFCAHSDAPITHIENGVTTIGTFIDIGDSGEAIIKTQSNQIYKIYSGSLRINR